MIRDEVSPNCICLFGSLNVSLRKSFISSGVDVRLPRRLSPNNFLVKPYGLETKANQSRALSFLLLMYHSAIRKDIIFGTDVVKELCNGSFSSSFAFFYCFQMAFNSTLHCLILFTLRFSTVFLFVFFSSYPKRCEAYLTLIFDIILKRVSTEPSKINFSISLMSESKSCQAFLSTAAGHLIFSQNVSYGNSGDICASAWKNWALW